MKEQNNIVEIVNPEIQSEETKQEEIAVVETKGKDLKILGMKVHVEKAEKKAKEPKDSEQKPDKKKRAGKIIAGIGGGLLVTGAIAKGVLDTVARRNAIQQAECQENDPYPNAQDGVYTEVKPDEQENSVVEPEET